MTVLACLRRAGVPAIVALALAACGDSSKTTGGSEPECAPQCAGRVCGTDQCGGLCPPGCPTGQSCNVAGSCVASASTLVVSKEGSGAGTVKGPGIDCGSVCSVVAVPDSVVELVGDAEGGSSIGAWTGCDTVSGDGTTCKVTVSGTRQVTVRFDACSPACSGRQCGPNGCGGSCGECKAGQSCDSNGHCICAPNCANRTCGSDGCGGSCGSCPAGQACGSSGHCACAPNCVGRECGPDGCGGECGLCPLYEPWCIQTNTGASCSNWCVPLCQNRYCGLDPQCGISCGTCPASDPFCLESATGAYCSPICIPQCENRACGPDPSCGITCGICPPGQKCVSLPAYAMCV